MYTRLHFLKRETKYVIHTHTHTHLEIWKDIHQNVYSSYL